MLICLASTPASAHEFWFAPVGGALHTGDVVSLTLRVGEFFEGDLAGFAGPQTVMLQQYTSLGSRDLRGLLPTNRAVGQLAVPLTTSGTHLFAFENHPSTISLPDGRFYAYLHDEGLDFINAQREAAGTAATPGRERYRRFVKTLVRVGDEAPTASQSSPANDKTYATETRQRLEIIPVNDPLSMSPGDSLGLRVMFEGKPLEGALLKAWHKGKNQTLLIRARTAADGTASFDLPYAGPWMISVVHMVKAIGARDIDWDSLWGNLSFVVPADRHP